MWPKILLLLFYIFSLCVVAGLILHFVWKMGAREKKRLTRIMFLRKSFLNAEISSVELINPSIKKDKLGEGYGIVLNSPDN